MYRHRKINEAFLPAGKYKPADGGNGGKGGDVILEATARCSAPLPN